MEVGDDGGSGVVGGVLAALERRMLAAGDLLRTTDLPRFQAGAAEAARRRLPSLLLERSRSRP